MPKILTYNIELFANSKQSIKIIYFKILRNFRSAGCIGENGGCPKGSHSNFSAFLMNSKEPLKWLI